MDIPVIYDVLLLLTTIFMYVSGYLIKKHKHNYWLFAAIGIVAFSLNEGLRFGRDYDYNVYYIEYTYGDESKFELAFCYFFKLCHYLNFSWQFVIFLFSLQFIVSVYIFLKDYKEIAPYSLLCLPTFTILFASFENFIRWYAGASFLIIGLHFLLRSYSRKNIFLFFIFSTLAVLNHTGLILFPILFFVLSFKDKELMPVRNSFLLFFILLFLFQTKFMMVFDHLFAIMGNIDKYQTYASDTERWLTSGYGGDEDEIRLTPIILMVCTCYIGAKANSYFKYRYNILYNLFLISFVFSPIYMKIELLDRYGRVLEFLGAFVCGFIFLYFKNTKKRWYSFSYIFFILAFLNCYRSMMIRPFEIPKLYQYTWDNKGQNYLPEYCHGDE